MKDTFTTDIGFAHAVKYRQQMLRHWMGKSNSYNPADLPDHFDLPTNDDVSIAETIEFRLRPLPLGVSYTAYLTKDNVPEGVGTFRFAGRITPYRITTWTGQTLAHVISYTAHRNHRGYLTDTRGWFRARGIDGRMYYGQHNGVGMYCRMRLSKNQ